MIFTKVSITQISVLLAVAVSLAACQSAAPQKPAGDLDPGAKTELPAAPAPKAGDVSDGEVSDGQAAPPTISISPNPYLLNPPSVSPAAQTAFAEAKQALAAEQWARAEQLLLRMTSRYPQLSGPHLNLAQLYSRTDRSDKARSQFEAAVAANGTNVFALNAYAIHQRQQGDFDKAEQLYKRAISVWPDFAEAHLNLGILYDLYRGKQTLALQQYERYQSLQTKPNRRVAGWIVDLKRRLKSN